MSQAYSAGFARIYNRYWADFANRLAPALIAFYAGTGAARNNRNVLDVCCGTGQLAAHFLAAGFQVMGVDLSEPMLAYARENCRPYVETGRACFACADAACFDAGAPFGAPFGLAVSTYDALNHLPDMQALLGCFQSVRRAVAAGGWFIFDLNTPAGLRQWNTMSVTENDDVTLIQRGLYDVAAGWARVMITGFAREPGGRYQRFEQAAYNTVFDLSRVVAGLDETGWREVRFALAQDLAAPLADPERHGRVYVIARKPEDA